MLLTSLYLHTKSWIDIIIQNKVEQHDAVQYPSETISLFGNDYSAKKVRSSISNVLLLRLSKKIQNRIWISKLIFIVILFLSTRESSPLGTQ